jgi:hypothetical protein
MLSDCMMLTMLALTAVPLATAVATSPALAAAVASDQV